MGTLRYAKRGVRFFGGRAPRRRGLAVVLRWRAGGVLVVLVVLVAAPILGVFSSRRTRMGLGLGLLPGRRLVLSCLPLLLPSEDVLALGSERDGHPGARLLGRWRLDGLGARCS